MSSPRPLFISFIDETNKPLFVHTMSYTLDDVNNTLKFNTFSNIALDYFDSALFQWKTTKTTNQTAIKLLFDLEDVSVFAMWVKLTGLKILVGFNSNSRFALNNDPLVEPIFEKVKKLYVKVRSNPFVDISKNSEQDTCEKLSDLFEKEFASSTDEKKIEDNTEVPDS